MRIQNTPFGRNPFKRGVAIITAALFLFTGLLNYVPPAFAQPVNANVQGGDPSKDLSRLVRDVKIRIPPELGKIDEVYFAPDGGQRMADGEELKTKGLAPSSILHPISGRKTIVFLQDAHDSLEAQENIAKIINHLVAHDGIKTVFEEGYEGPVPTDNYFGFIKDLTIKEKVSYFLMDHLRVGGAEYAHINRTKDFNLVGADSLKLHKENIGQYRLSAAKKDVITKDLKALEKELKSLADARFPKALKEWLKIKEQFDAKKLDLFTYLGRTFSLADSVERRGDRNDKKLSVKRSALHADGLFSFILEAIRSNDPAVIEKAKHIDAREIFGELIKLEQAVAETYLHKAEDKQLLEYYKILSLLDRLNDLQVSQEEYEAVKNSLKTFDTDSFAKFIFSQSPKTLILSRMWEQNIKDAIKFYEIAHQRDNSLSEMLDKYFLEKGKEQNAKNKDNAETSNFELRTSSSKLPGIEPAILVYGGFHKENIKRVLEVKGISYLVVSPRITKPSPRHEAFYKKLMTDGDFPFERAIATKPLAPATMVPAERIFARSEGRMEVLAVANALYADRNADLGTLHRVIGRAEMRDLNHERTTRFEMQETNGRQAAGIDEMGSVHAQDLSLKKNVMSRRSESRDDQEVPLNSRLEKIPEKDRRVAAQRIWQLLLDRYQFPEKGSLIEFVSSEPSSVPEVLASRKFKGTLMLTGGNKAVLRNLERYRHLLPGAKIIPVLLDAFNQGSGFLNPVDGVIVNAFTRMSSEDSSRGLDWKSFFIKASPAFVIASRDALLRNDRISSDDFRRAKDLFEQISASVPKNTRDLESEMIVETEGFESDSWMAFCLRPILSLEQEMRKEPQALDRLGRSSFIRQTAYKDPVESMAGIYGNRAMLGRFLPPWTDSKNMLDAIERQFSVATLKRGQGSDGLKLEKYLPVFVDYQFDPTGIATNGNLGSGRAFYIGSRFNVKGVKTALVSHESDKWHSDGFLDLPTAVWEAIVSNSLHYDLRTGTAPVLGIIDAVKTFDNPSWPGSREAAALLVRMDDGSLDRPTHLFKKNEPLNKKRMLRVATMFGKGEAEKFIERIFHGAWSAGNISVEGRMLDYDTVLSVRHRPPQVVGKTFYTTNLFGLEQNGQLMILEGLAQSEVNRGKVSLKDLKHAMEEAYASQIRTRFLDLMGLSTPFKDAVGQQFERELKILADEFQALSRMMLPRYNAWDIHAPDHDELAVFDFSNFFRYYPLLRRSPQWSIEKAFFLLLNPDAETERKENDAIPDFMKRYVEEHGYVVQDDGMLEDCCRRALFFIFAYDSLFAKIRGSVFAPLEDSAEMKAYIVNEDRSYLSPLFGRRIKQNLVEMYQGRKIKAERFSLLIDKIVQASRRVPSRIFDNYYLADMELYVNGYSGKLLSKDGSFRFFTAFFDQEEMPKEQGSWSIRLNGKKYDCAIERHDDEMWVISPAFDNQKLLENLVPTLLFKNRKFRLQSLGPSRPVFAPFMKDDPSVIKGLERLQQMRQVSSMDTNGKAGSPGMSFDLSQFDPARMTWDQFMGLIWQDIFKKIQLPKDGVVVEVAPGSGSQIAWGLKKYGFLGTVYVLEPAKVIKKAVDSYQRLVPGVKVVSIQKTLREGMESLPRNPHLVVGNHALDDMFLGEILPLKEVAEIFDHSDRLPASVAVKAWRRAEKGLSVLKRLVSEGRVLRDWICLMAEVTPQWLILNHYLSYYYSEKGCHFPNQEGFSLLARLSHMFLGLGCDVEFLRRRFIETSDLWVAIRPGKARSLRDSQRNKPNRTALDKRSEMRLKQEPAAEKEPNDKNPRGAEMLSSIDSSKEFARVDGLGLDSVDLIEQGPRPDNKFTDLPRIESQENWEQSPLSPISDQMPPDAAEAPGHNQTKSSVPYIREMRLMDDSLTPVRIGEGLYQIADETSLSIVMTDLCNGNCAFCINKTGSQHSGEAVARNFPQKLSKAMSAYHVKDVVLLGGEPLLARHLGEVLGELDKVKDQLDEVTVTTNGTPLRDKNILELVGNSSITSVNISYHHYDKKRNDAIMETSTLTIGEIEEINRFLMSRGKTLRVNLIAFKSGIDNVSDLERFAESFSNKIDVIKLTPMYPTASYETIDSVSEFTKSHAFSRQEWMQLLDGLSAKGEVLAENEDIFGVQRTLIKLPSGVKILFVNPYTDKKEPTKIRSVKILSDGKMSLSWLGHGPDLMTAPVEFPRIPDTGEEKEIFTADGREMKAAEADRAMAKDITVRSEMRSEDAAVASLSHYPINSIVGGFKVEEVASLLGISEAETQTRLAALTTEGTLLRFHVTTGKEPDQSEQSFREGKLTIDEFLERESAFYRGQGAERFLMAGSLLRKAALTLKRGELSDEHLYQMAEALTLLFGDKLNYTLRQALGLWSSAEVYLQEEEVAEIAEINNRLEMINKRNQGIQRDIFSKKIPFDNQYRQDWKKMSRTDVVSLIKEVLVEIKKGIDDIRWLQAQDVGGLENRLRANPIDRADALLTLMAYKKGLQTGLAQLEMVYGIYSETMTDQAVASGDAAMAKDAPVRSEARVQPIAPIMNKAVLVIEQTTIDLMTATDFKKLLCLAGTRRSEIRLVIPDVVHGQYSNRVVALRSVATVDIRLPEMARSGKIPVFGFSDMERDTVGAFKARLGRAEPRIVPHLQECFALDGMDGIVLALLVNRPEDLQMKNGFLYDQTGRFRSEVRAFVEALVQNYVVISSAA